MIFPKSPGYVRTRYLGKGECSMMARRKRRYVVPGVEQGMQAFKADVMRREGYTVNPNLPDDVKYEVAKELGVSLHPGDNGSC